MEALVGAFKQEMALEGAFSVIVKTDGSFAALVMASSPLLRSTLIKHSDYAGPGQQGRGAELRTDTIIITELSGSNCITGAMIYAHQRHLSPLSSTQGVFSIAWTLGHNKLGHRNKYHHEIFCTQG